jgi:ABC-type sugar transport system permease subunit
MGARLRSLVEEVKESRTSYLLLLPYVVYFLAFLAYPLLFAFYLTFHEWAIIAPEKPFVGLDNYVKLWHDDVFWTSMKNVLVYLSINLPAQVTLSLALALLVNQKIRFRGFFRSVFFMPSVVSGVVVSTVFLWLYSPQFGLLNYYLGKIGIPPLRWITSVDQAMPSIALMASWRQVGYFAVIYLAGLQAIPPVLYKAASVDGANGWRQFWHVTLPLLNPTILLVLMVSTIWGFLVFTEPFVMTEGGPLHATTTPALYLYKEAFSYLRMGYAATVGVVLGLIILVINMVEKKWVEQEIAY